MDHAYHEAGHAVAAALLGAEVVRVTLDSDREDHDGHCEVHWRGLDPDSVARLSLRVAFAGPIAELCYRGELPEDAATLSAWRGDHAEAERCLRALGPRVDPERERLAAIAELVRVFEDVDVWERVARVADALDAHGELDADLFADAIDTLPGGF